jgi:hypothetical protein
MVPRVKVAGRSELQFNLAYAPIELKIIRTARYFGRFVETVKAG